MELSEHCFKAPDTNGGTPVSADQAARRPSDDHGRRGGSSGRPERGGGADRGQRGGTEREGQRGSSMLTPKKPRLPEPAIPDDVTGFELWLRAGSISQEPAANAQQGERGWCGAASGDGGCLP